MFIRIQKFRKNYHFSATNEESRDTGLCSNVELRIGLIVQGRHVHLSFVTFELEEEQDCGYDFIEVSPSNQSTNQSINQSIHQSINVAFLQQNYQKIYFFMADNCNGLKYSYSYTRIIHINVWL